MTESAIAILSWIACYQMIHTINRTSQLFRRATLFGVIGLMFLIGVSVFLFRKEKFSLIAISALIVLIVIGMVDHYLWTLPQGMAILFILLVGCVLWNSYNKRV